MRRTYERVLNESLSTARDRAGEDSETERMLRHRFETCIPKELPSDMTAFAADQELPSLLRQRAAEELLNICLSIPEPQTLFATHVAQKAAEIQAEG